MSNVSKTGVKTTRRCHVVQNGAITQSTKTRFIYLSWFAELTRQIPYTLLKRIKVNSLSLEVVSIVLWRCYLA